MGSITVGSLRTTKEFSKVYKRGRYFHTASFVLYFLKEENTLLGVVASKKVGNAVKRNRAKRRLRALFKEDEKTFAGHYVLVAKRPVIETEFSVLQDELKKALERVTQNKKRKNSPKKSS